MPKIVFKRLKVNEQKDVLAGNTKITETGSSKGSSSKGEITTKLSSTDNPEGAGCNSWSTTWECWVKAPGSDGSPSSG